MIWILYHVKLEAALYSFSCLSFFFSCQIGILCKSYYYSLLQDWHEFYKLMPNQTSLSSLFELMQKHDHTHIFYAIQTRINYYTSLGIQQASWYYPWGFRITPICKYHCKKDEQQLDACLHHRATDAFPHLASYLVIFINYVHGDSKITNRKMKAGKKETVSQKDQKAKWITT